MLSGRAPGEVRPRSPLMLSADCEPAILTHKQYIYTENILYMLNLYYTERIDGGMKAYDFYNAKIGKADNGFPGKSAHPLHYYHIKGTSPIDCWYGP